jgi:NADH-quinone oxidoreductase subunit J
MNVVFYLAAAVALFATVMMLTRLEAVHALLYLVVSLLSTAVMFYVLGAPFLAALEVIVYAGAIVVLFIFVVMMLNIGSEARTREGRLLQPGAWAGPALLCGVLAAEVFYVVLRSEQPASVARHVSPSQLGMALYGPYVIGVELASMLLLAGVVGAWHLGARGPELEEEHGDDSLGAFASAGGEPDGPGARGGVGPT